jgi:hypothetical protein
MAFAGLVLVFAGLVFWVVSRWIAGGESHSFTPGAVAPTYVEVTAGHTYSLAVPGGALTVAGQGRQLKSVQCTANQQDQAPAPLQLALESDTSKATDRIATFVAQDTGLIHVACPGLTHVFVDNADGRADDPSGRWLVLASIALAVGIPLTLSVLRRPGRFGRPLPVPADAD